MFPGRFFGPIHVIVVLALSIALAAAQTSAAPVLQPYVAVFALLWVVILFVLASRLLLPLKLFLSYEAQTAHDNFFLPKHWLNPYIEVVYSWVTPVSLFVLIGLFALLANIVPWFSAWPVAWAAVFLASQIWGRIYFMQWVAPAEF